MFITGIKLDEIGTTSYINELPVVRHLLAIPRMNLTTPVTFVVGGERVRQIHPGGGHCCGEWI